MIVPTTSEDSSRRKRGVPDDLSDDYIFNEINLYANRSVGLNQVAEKFEHSSTGGNVPQIGNPFEVILCRSFQNFQIHFLGNSTDATKTMRFWLMLIPELNNDRITSNLIE